MEDVLIPSLMTGDCNDSICVRASRFWEFYDLNEETKLLHADLVLIDEEGNSIHAQIYPNAFQRFKTLIKEGNVYNLACFRVRKSNDRYKPVTNESMITLSTWTTVEEVVEIPPAFPMFTYSLTPIEQLPSRVDYPEYFTDVIGIVTTISNIMSLRARGRQNDSLKRVVTICNESNVSVDVVLWGERASSFPAEQMQKEGEAHPQVVIFVGTLVKKYSSSGAVTLAGNSPCKWYINPDVPEARALLSSIGKTNQPIKWDQQMTPAKATPAVEHKKVSEIKDLNPFKYKKMDFLVTVAIKKIDSSWWYNSCYKCARTAKPYGDLYKCTDSTCNYTGKPVQRYKPSIIAGDETGDTNFIMFGRWVQRLTKKAADTLIAKNPQGFIPNEITRLLEKVFKFNVSFTENTTSSDKVCFQVNAVVAEVNDTNVLTTGSQSSSLLISQSVGSSMQRTPQKSAAFTLTSQSTGGSHASGTTPTKTINIPESQLTPQSHGYNDQITPTKETDIALVPTEQDTRSVNALDIFTQTALATSTDTPQKNDDTIFSKDSKDGAANSTTKIEKTNTRKMSELPT
ncbi:replication protein A 70 kDa DNA-binding subunit C-like [Panicum virgatum]|uniref:replication protein A 70 kDa DNA-binding subunit C-like n=1 Tax=Panicum virgatum TaxID=38727 RepID=UPI0019D55E3F|nr:replication protein A 70 kDa DNA-binding subunit C-like [Panicum virgatum]